MHKSILAYLKHIRPGPHPNGNALLKEGIAMGQKIKAGKSRFIRESGHETYLDYRKQKTSEGKIIWNILMGLSTLEEQIEGTKKIHEFCQRTGLTLDSLQPIASGVIALPKEYREKAPATTSFVMDGFEDYRAQVEAAPIEVMFNDYHLASPNGLEMTINSVKAGAAMTGEFSQIIWSYPGYDDDMTRFSNMVRALGILSTKNKKEKMAVKTYLDDGLPGYALDCITYVGYAMLEHYICSTLCGVRYMVAYGGLLSDIDKRLAIAMALHKALSTEDQQILHYINNSTNMHWDHDIEGNYGTAASEFLFEILVEKRYRMGMGINPVSITEKLRVPTCQELINIFTVGKRVEESADHWEAFMDFSALEKLRDEMIEKGTVFFRNVLSGLEQAGYDINDPLEMILAIRNINPLKFEQCFHPTSFETGGEVKPFCPSELASQTLDQKEQITAQLKVAGLDAALKGKRIAIASADAHTYGLILAEGVLSAAGAQIINGGVDMDAADLLDLADEEGVKHIGISCHNGQALDYGKQILRLAKDRGKEYFIFMGGLLNGYLPGGSEPVDVSHILNDMGILADNDFAVVTSMISQN